MARGNDEPFTLYGLLAESVETDDARSYVTFRINPKAAFSDGKPVTAEDVLFSLRAAARQGPAQPPHSTTPRSSRPRRSTRAPCASTSPAPTTASCR